VQWLGNLASSYGGFNVISGGLFLSMGTPMAPRDGEMSFAAVVTSEFPGESSWLQLVNCQNESGFPTLVVSTEGKLNVDGGSIIYDETLKDLEKTTSKNPVTYTGMPLVTDCPRMMIGNHYTQINSTFIDFVRFKPYGADSIWITLGRVDWSWNAQASYDSQGSSILPINQVTGPNFTLSNQFPPRWYDFKSGFSIIKDQFWYLFLGLT
jgi:hypothetical protein